MPEKRVPANEAEGLPPPVVGLILWRVTLAAIIATMPRKRAEAALRIMADMLASEAAVSDILHIRPEADHDALRMAQRQAAAVFSAHAPTFFAALRPK